MFAVIKAGGHQYRVQEGDKIQVDLLKGKAGDKVTFDQVMLVGGSKATIGDPLVKGAVVEATIREQLKSPKVVVFKYKRKKNYKRNRGHRQPVTLVEVNKIKA